MNLVQLAARWSDDRSRGASCYDLIEVLRDSAVRGDVLAYGALVGERRRQRPDAEGAVGALAKLIAAESDPAAYWPVVLLLLSPPYPNDATTQLNLLSLVHSVRLPQGQIRRVIGRIAAKYLTYALRRANAPLVTEEAVNVLSGLDPEQLAGATPQERAEISQAAAEVIYGIDDPELAEHLGQRVRATLDGLQYVEPVRQEDAQIACALADAEILEQKLGAEGFTPELEWIQGDIRAAIWSMVTTPQIVAVQRLRIELPSEPKASVDAWDVVDRWIELFTQSVSSVLASRDPSGAIEARLLPMTFMPVAAQHSSIGITFAIANDSIDQGAMDAAMAVVANALDNPEEGAFPEVLSQLIEELRQKKLSISIEQRSTGGTPSSLRIGKSEIEKMITHWKGGSFMSRIGTGDVPQANVLDRVLRVADCLATGMEISMTTLEIDTPRQVAYYRQAARILGLTTASGALTPAGWMAHRVTDPDDRIRRAAVLFEACPVGQSWVAWSKGQTLLQVAPGSAKQYLADCSALTGDTIGRRANCLEQWLKDFQRVLK